MHFGAAETAATRQSGPGHGADSTLVKPINQAPAWTTLLKVAGKEERKERLTNSIGNWPLDALTGKW